MGFGPFAIIPFCNLIIFFFFINQVFGNGDGNSGMYPIVVSTWPFVDAVRAAWRVADGGFSAVDAVVEGCSTCEELRCDGTGGIVKYL